MIDETGRYARWSVDGTALYYVREDNVWTVSIDGGRELPVTDLRGRPGGLGAHLATDGEFLYFTWHENTGDIWVMDVAHE